MNGTPGSATGKDRAAEFLGSNDGLRGAPQLVTRAKRTTHAMPICCQSSHLDTIQWQRDATRVRILSGGPA